MDGYWSRPDLYALPAHLSPLPHLWSRDDVSKWAEWCCKEYSLDMKVEKFQMNGKALCMLTKEDFKERAPEAGDVLYNTLQTLLVRAARTDSHTRWSSLHLSNQGNGLPWDVPAPYGIDLPWLRARYARGPLPVCGRQSPPHSPISAGLPPRPPGSPVSDQASSPRLAYPSASFTPWSPDYKAGHHHSPPRLVSVYANNEAVISEASRDGKDRTEHALASDDKHGGSLNNADDKAYIDVCDEALPDKAKTMSSSPTLGTLERHPAGISKYSSDPRLSGETAPVSLDMRISCHDVKVYENQGRTFHIKAEPDDCRRTLQMGLHYGSDVLHRGCTSQPTFPFNKLSPPSSPDSQTSQVLPSAVEGERVTPQGEIIDKDELEKINLQENQPNHLSWSTQYPAGALPYIKGSRKLWEFLWGLMDNPAYKSVIRWEDKSNGVFRILNTSALAQLWGRQKNKDNMTYEKMSRALRYYYRMNILKKVAGKRLTYRFAKDPSSILEMKRWARTSSKGGEEAEEMDS